MQVTDEDRFIHLQQTTIHRNRTLIHGIAEDICVRNESITI
ncbi:hypothetical protein [Winogradskyella flava]|nr:hypothetical protein [Winogradskyella flava]